MLFSHIEQATNQRPLTSAVQLLTGMRTFGCSHVAPGPICPSLENLDTRDSSMVPMLMPALVRTPGQHDLLTSMLPILKPFIQSGLQVAGLQEYATTPGQELGHSPLLWCRLFANSQSRHGMIVPSVAHIAPNRLPWPYTWFCCCGTRLGGALVPVYGHIMLKIPVIV